jgi:hypothetical protein
MRAQIGVRRKRQAAHVGQGPDIVGLDAELGELLPVKRHAFGDAADGGLKALDLEAFEVGAAGRFNGLIPKHDLLSAADAVEEPDSVRTRHRLRLAA